MIIVIVLIGIMLSITLNISGNQTKELRFRIARENFLANYNSFIIRAITTNSSDSQLIFTKDSSGPIYPS
jgi:type II secretory pathway pseudopilin PulG